MCDTCADPASAIITGVAGDAVSGTLTLFDVMGTFENGVAIDEDDGGGDAFALGTLQGGDVAPEPEIHVCELLAIDVGCVGSPINSVQLGIGSGFEFGPGGNTATLDVQDMPVSDFHLDFIDVNGNSLGKRWFRSDDFLQSHFQLDVTLNPGVTAADFAPGDILTQDLTGATAEVDSVDAGLDRIYVINLSAQVFDADELVRGSGDTTDVVNPNGGIRGPTLAAVSFSEVSDTRKVVIINIAGNDGIPIPGATVGVTGIKLSTPSGRPAFTLISDLETRTLEGVEGEELPVGTLTSTSVTIRDGAYYATGAAPDAAAASDLDITATFAGNAAFATSTSGDDAPPSNLYDLGETTGVASGFQLNAASDSGTGFTAIVTNPGNDGDGDGARSAWEFPVSGVQNINYWAFATTLNYAIPIVDPRTDLYGSPGITVAPLGKAGKKDVWVELDFMKGHKPDVGAMNNVIASFGAAPVEGALGTLGTLGAKGIKLHLYVDEEIDHVNDLNVWRDADTIYNNDFKSIKNRFFGEFTERMIVGEPVGPDGIELNGDELSSFGIGGSTSDRKRLQIKDLPIFLPDPSIATLHDGDLTFSIELEFATDVVVVMNRCES